jgi:DNA invertase Pin-like site-specific DNA recombinase
LASQEKFIREYCARNKVEIIEMFIDDGKKSYTFDRPDYIALEKFIKKHRGTVQYLIVLDHDRFSRNLAEALTKIEYLEKKHHLKVLATNEPLDLDTADPMVFMQRAFKYMMANQELFTIRRRAKIGIRQAQESGRFVHLAPFGYFNSKDAGGKSLIIIDESRSFIIQKIFRDYLTGVPQFMIYKEVKKLGFTLNGRDAIIRVLTNAAYAGLIKVKANEKQPEKYVKAVHEPIITEHQYWRTQEMLGTNKRIEKVQPREDFPLRGFLHCYCGAKLTAANSKG